MAQALMIPIRFQFTRIPAIWELRAVQRKRQTPPSVFAFPKVVSAPAGESLKLSELDGWICRNAFFDLPEGDNEALLRFLADVGVFSEMKIASHWSAEVTRHCREGGPVPIDVAALWKFREGLKRALIDRQGFKESYAPELSSPKTDIQMVLESRIAFSLGFELTKVASGVVATSDAYHMLLATVYADVALGIRFKMCARKDCGKPFPIESKHKRKFCCQPCGHLVSQRKKRARDKKASAKAANARTKRTR